MKITCESCQSKYTVSDEKVQGKTVKIKCRKCGATILVGSNGITTSSAGSAVDPVFAVSSSSSDGMYTVNVGDGDQRAMSVAEIANAYNARVVTADTYVWTEGMGDWLPLGQVDAIVAALNNEGPDAGTPTPLVNYASGPGAGFGTSVAATSSPGTATPESQSFNAPRTAARRETRGRGAQDLFGGGGLGEAVAVNEEVATSAPIFGGSAPSGQRDENSVLFSLSALTAKAGGSATSAVAPPAKEDSGLIDLKALSSGGAPSATSDLVHDNGAMFPLGMPVLAPVATMPVAMESIPAAPPNRTPIFIAIGGVVALSLIVAAFLIVKGSGPPPVAATPAPTLTTPPPPTTPPETAAPPATEASAEPTASASTTTVAVGPRGPRPPPGKLPAPGGTTKAGATGTGTGPAAPPPKPKGKDCGCGGDLMCQIKCSSGGK